MRITPVETGHKIQLPAEWALALGLESRVALEKTREGILVRPCPPVPWEDVFADKLPMGSPAPAGDLSEVSGDDLLL